MSAIPIEVSRPRPIKCQMKMAETANFGTIRSQPARDILAVTMAIKPSIIAIMKMKITIRPAGFVARARTIHQRMSRETINPMMVKMKPTEEIYAGFWR